MEMKAEVEVKVEMEVDVEMMLGWERGGAASS